jgi:hypothetical protein
MKRLLIAAASVAFGVTSAACGPNDVGSKTTSSGLTSADGGTSDGGAPLQNTCTPATFTCSGAQGLYPGCPYGTSRGGVFPDFFLGEGYWNSGTTPTNDIGLTPEQTMAFHLL